MIPARSNRTVVGYLACAGLAVALTGLAAGRQTGEMLTIKDLQGRWQVVGITRSGIELDRQQSMAQNLVMEIKDDSYTATQVGQEMEKGKVMLDATKTPAHCDLDIQEGNDKGKKQPGIIRMRDGKLEWCLANPGADARPKEFASGAGSTDLFFRLEKAK
jgi:uncharacterized protein (TIGR03067 family)